ncbi:MAG: nucleoside-diphosphate sugar epimerase/dehydratase [Clostridia bacterium]|nr:nucleoside-diphosphate sugar epimerase/dehydratase [Clostridia bacterium]
MAAKPKPSQRTVLRTLLYIGIDLIVVNVAFAFAMMLRFNLNLQSPTYLHYNAALSRLVPFLSLICILCFTLTGLYRRLWKYAGLDEIFYIALGSGFTVVVTYAFARLCDVYELLPKSISLPRAVYITAWFIMTFLTVVSRMGGRAFWRVTWRAAKSTQTPALKRVMVVGAGWAGVTTIRDIRLAGNSTVVIAVDDDPAKAGTRIARVKVLFSTENIPEYARRYSIDEIIIAIPSASTADKRRIIQICAQTECKLRYVPTLSDVVDGKPQTGAIRDVNIADLLCRDEVKLDMDSIRSYLTDRTVLVTGGGGSIGSELCRQIARFAPKKLIIFDIYENNAYELYYELRRKYGDALDVTVLIGSIRDRKRLEAVFGEYRPDVVFHAAAHKHVPLMEDSPAEAVKNNVGGTLNVALCADKYGVKQYVQLSTDKAVNPTNVMGATKRITELIVQYMAARSRTEYMAVRFGNVLGSNGSVIPLFKQQIANGGPVTLTHPDMERYFMTIPEASQLVLQAGASRRSGSLFILDMGTPVKIADLAHNLIRLSGFIPGRDIEIQYVGLRPGEKLYEELMKPEERARMQKTHHEQIFIAPPIDMDYDRFESRIQALLNRASDDPAHIREAIREFVPEYHPQAEDSAAESAS